MGDFMTLGKLALCAATVAAIAAPSLAADIEGPMLNAHNSLRAKHGVPPLSWSASLANTAQAWADRCVFEHSNAGLGENLAQGTGDYSGANAVNDWYNEISAYDFNSPGFSDATGHFTQVIWKSTKKVGCGVAQCSDGALYVCNYEPAGNTEGAFPDNVPPTK
jgi:uncharacterized protein YkwD